MGRFAMLVAAVVMFVFASPAMAQNPGSVDVEATVPESAAQGQYEPNGPSTQSVEEAIEDAIEDAQENNAAVDGTEAYVETLSPGEADAAEAAEEPVGMGASARYQSLPDTGGPSLPLAAALAIFLAGGMLVWRR